MRHFVRIGLFSTMAFAAAACGYSEEEWQAQLDKYNRLVTQDQQKQKQLDEMSKALQEAQDKVTQLEKELEAAGVDLKKLGADAEQRAAELAKLSASQRDLEAALAEYKKRADQLERIKARFDALRSKLNALTSLGLTVNIHNNRMVISLPGDVLFDSGKDTLKKDGEEILDKVATVIKADASLLARDYQVAGHTDSEQLKGGPFHDNWGLSLMRARSVLLYLVDDKHGGMPVTRWSAAGFAATDPVADNTSKEGKQKNRRCDLIVVPSAEEMLDLNKIAQ